jgi:hypothetical protein
MSKELDITAKDVKRLILTVYRNLKRGELTDSQAYRETFILNSILKTIEVSDLEERLINIERALHD